MIPVRDTARRAVSAWTLAGALLLGGTACSAQEEGASSAAIGSAENGEVKGPPVVPVSGLTKGLALPLEAYMLNYADGLQIERSKQRLAAACMKRLGFRYRVPELGLMPPPSSNDANMPRRYGITDLEESETLGYQVPSVDISKVNADVNPTEAEWQALMGRTAPGPEGMAAPTGSGIPENGCLGEASRKLGAEFGDTKTGELNRKSYENSLGDPAVQDVIKRWSACMRSSGYRFTDPQNAPFAHFGESSTPSAEEIRTAVTDVTCKEKTDLVGVWFSVETRMQREFIEENQLVLDAEKKQVADAIRNASRM
ncbi:hypothetical protein K373_02321 [Streptomyces sp. DvalAA-21]|nr:conserved hypothetical protein [Streptomyces sp. SirexAA-E]PZX40149.1 hypothetical protein K373_02321 [Streptomyces sp. DvalAA-21]RAJ36316.1 hypothetical protein K351_02068 [Streptomyces sp. DpondAA-E10]RAJ50283.1 hypothetical protein K352_01463 [Streptomyces sp. DpondAA-A50]SCD64331.1 hypothetical protein GA0115239_10498 [Streptomyces sp. BpilaLS-43]SCE46949.1 hypothetical protein GA0115235_12088 [Streptomyces sp. DpondAA-F4a]SCM14091.1 hypothetical protein SAMN04883147_110334 [Streptomyc